MEADHTIRTVGKFKKIYSNYVKYIYILIMSRVLDVQYINMINCALVASAEVVVVAPHHLARLCLLSGGVLKICWGCW